jgi:hypothetical protein
MNWFTTKNMVNPKDNLVYYHAKINSIVAPNSMVIGSDLYYIVSRKSVIYTKYKFVGCYLKSNNKACNDFVDDEDNQEWYDHQTAVGFYVDSRYRSIIQRKIRKTT